MCVASVSIVNFNLYGKTGLVVEDAATGIMSGKASGARTLATCTTSPRQAFVDAQPDWIVPDLTQYVHLSKLPWSL